MLIASLARAVSLMLGLLLAWPTLADEPPASSLAAETVINGCRIAPRTQCPGANLRHADLKAANLAGANLALLTADTELALMTRLAEFPGMLTAAAADNQNFHLLFLRL